VEDIQYNIIVSCARQAVAEKPIFYGQIDAGARHGVEDHSQILLREKRCRRLMIEVWEFAGFIGLSRNDLLFEIV
jgi:hypothetical protein